MMKRTITALAVAIALPLLADAATPPPGSELDQCRAAIRARLKAFVNEIKAEGQPEDWIVTLQVVAYIERELQFADLAKCERMRKAWAPPARQQKTARPDLGKGYGDYAGNDMAKAQERVRDRDEERRSIREWEQREREWRRRQREERERQLGAWEVRLRDWQHHLRADVAAKVAERERILDDRERILEEKARAFREERATQQAAADARTADRLAEAVFAYIEGNGRQPLVKADLSARLLAELLRKVEG